MGLDLINKTLGQFEIRRELGRGGMAVVYEAFQPALQRTVALKVLPPGMSHDADFVRRFKQEAIAAASLRHPNIVAVYDVGDLEPYHFIVMEYLAGQSLQAVIRSSGALPLERVNKIVHQVAQALDYAHQHGFIHRDVKPGNIILDAEGHATLTDFGLARAMTGAHLTQTGTIVGTPAYMAPEQIMGQAVDARTDIYALGIVIFEMLTGRTPFAGDTTAVLYKHVHEPPPPLAELAPRVPPPVVQAVLRALAKDPAQRFKSAGELAAALTGASTATKVPTLPTPPAQSTPPTPLPTFYTPPPQPVPPGVQRPASGWPGWLPWLLAIIGLGLLACAAVILGVIASQPGFGQATLTPEIIVVTKPPIVVIVSATPGANKPTPPAARPTPTLPQAQIEASVRNAVERFQTAKEYSQKTGDTSKLATVLAGQALERQVQLVNDTKAAGCYWDINLDAPMRYEFLEVRGDSYVRVKVFKVETRKKYCGGELVKSSSVDRESYNTTYVVEQINGRWFVTVRE
jgi:serine/threonine-protein kinase